MFSFKVGLFRYINHVSANLYRRQCWPAQEYSNLARIMHLRRKCCSQHGIRLTWQHLVYWTQWYACWNTISDIDRKGCIFRPSQWHVTDFIYLRSISRRVCEDCYWARRSRGSGWGWARTWRETSSSSCGRAAPSWSVSDSEPEGPTPADPRRTYVRYATINDQHNKNTQHNTPGH